MLHYTSLHLQLQVHLDEWKYASFIICSHHRHMEGTVILPRTVRRPYKVNIYLCSSTEDEGYIHFIRTFTAHRRKVQRPYKVFMDLCSSPQDEEYMHFVKIFGVVSVLAKRTYLSSLSDGYKEE